MAFGPVSISSFLVMGFVGVVLGVFVFWKKAKEEYYDESQILDVALGTMFWSIVWGRVLYILLHFEDFGLNLWYWVSVWSKPGFYWLGFYLGGGYWFIRYCIRHKWDVFKTLDLAVLGLSLMQVFVNLGLFMSGGAVGGVTRMPVGMVFPGTFEPRHPVALYAALFWLVLFAFLWWVEPRYRRFVWYQRFKGDSRPGFLVFVMISAYGLFQTILSFVSESEYVYLGIDVDLMLYICVFLLGLMGFFARSGYGARLGFDEWFGGSKKIKRR